MRRGLAARRRRLRLGESERRRRPRRSLVGAFIRSGHVRANVARSNEGVASLHQRREAPKPSSATPSAVTQMISAPQIATVRKGLKSSRLKGRGDQLQQTSATIKPADVAKCRRQFGRKT